jgi:hypothetical protein
MTTIEAPPTQLPMLPCGHRSKHTSRTGCCASCGHLFSSDSSFGRHRKHGECLPPESVGLEPRDSRTAPGETIWAIPGGGYYTQKDDQ